jgi:hypothetical protein
MVDGNKVIEEYIRWIKDNSFIRDARNGSYIAITTPFTDRHNDHVEIYVKEENGKFYLTDDGETLGDLSISGTDINTPKRQAVFMATVNGLGVQTDLESLFVEAEAGNLPQKKHALIQAILAVNDMHMMSQENVLAFFKEDVMAFFRENIRIPFVSDIKLPGKTGYDHSIDFIFPSTQSNPERIIKTVNKATKDRVQSAVFTFFDVQQLRQEAIESILIYNDNEAELNADAKKALSQYSISAYPWSAKDSLIASLV